SQRSCLTEISAQPYHRDSAIPTGDLPQQVERVITGAVIHEHDLKALASVLHHSLQTVIEISDVLLLVMQRNHNGVLGHEALIIRFSRSACEIKPRSENQREPERKPPNQCFRFMMGRRTCEYQRLRSR